MTYKLNDVIRFRGDRLFNGAVNIDWINLDPNKSLLASESFVFHGPQYHGIGQQDVGISHGHTLVDTATFSLKIANRCYNIEDEPFTLAIAGYGTGKSHLALTLATLFSEPQSSTSKNILKSLEVTDSTIKKELDSILINNSQPCLTITINGMRNSNLVAEFNNQISKKLNKLSLDTKYLANLRPRFKQASNLLTLCDESMKKELLSMLGLITLDEAIELLTAQDEIIYKQIHDYFTSKGLPLTAFGGESINDLIRETVERYCGQDKPFKSLLILFDEFGKYTEFATMKSQIAGSGVLQDLYEAVQNNANKVCFVGFIQFELNAYVQRVAPEFKNEVLRYISRFQNVDKLYLSTNMETLIASLLEKKENKAIKNSLNTKKSLENTNRYIKNLNEWFPVSKNYKLWSNEKYFHNIIREGCWPLSPYSTWTFFYLASAGKYLQERSALALLDETIKKFYEHSVYEIENWSISPVDLWSEVLKEEFLQSEESGQLGSITHSFSTVMEKYGSKLSEAQIKVLQTIVLSSKLGLVVRDKTEAILALSELTSINYEITESNIQLLQEEFNVIEWDNSFNSFDILGDAIPKTQLTNFLRQQIKKEYNEAEKSLLVVTKSKEWFPEIFKTFDCDFAEENDIYSISEWQYRSIISNNQMLPQNIRLSVEHWLSSHEAEVPKGTIIFVYVSQTESFDDIYKQNKITMSNLIKETGYETAPIILVYLNDTNGEISQGYAENTVINSLSSTEKSKFGNLLNSYTDKLLKNLKVKLEELIKERLRLFISKNSIESTVLSQICTKLYKQIYFASIPFPLDGFKGSRGNAADTINELTKDLLLNRLSFDSLMAKNPKVKNRGITLLKQSWGIYKKDGQISLRPKQDIIKTISEEWDNKLKNNEKPEIRQLLQQLFLPPYGLNVASAGLLFATYVSPRLKQIDIVKNNLQIAFETWIEQDFFKAKFINLLAIENSFISASSGESSEWLLLLDEWDSTPNHLKQADYYNQAIALRKRLPLPQSEIHRFDLLKTKAEESLTAIRKHEQILTKCLQQIETSQKAKDIKYLVDALETLTYTESKMKADEAWTEAQINEITSHIEPNKKIIIDIFDEWLHSQAPINSLPKTVGDYAHGMRNIAKNLKSLKLSNEEQKLLEHTEKTTKNAFLFAQVKDKVASVHNWLQENQSNLKIPKIIKLKSLFETIKAYNKDLNDLYAKTKLETLQTTRGKILSFGKEIKDIIDKYTKRSENIWEKKISTVKDLDLLLKDIKEIINVYEGESEDLEDFHLLNEALEKFKTAHTKLLDLTLNHNRIKQLILEYKESFEKWAENKDSLPWDSKEVFILLEDNIRNIRNSESQKWCNQIKKSIKFDNATSVTELNQMLQTLKTPPSYINNNDLHIINNLKSKVEDQLNTLEHDWLIERFKNLPENIKIAFLENAQKLLIKN